MKSRFPAVAFAYLVLAIVFVAMSALRIPYRDSPRYPSLSLVREPSQNLGGFIKSGLWHLDHAELRSSMDRSASVRLGREMGNSIRLLAGQRVEWIIWGGREPLMLFATIELWVSRGLTPQVRNELEEKADVIAGYARRLAAEGWILVVLPVPTKLGIHRELCEWPVAGPSLVSRDLVSEDRSDETNGYLVEGLRKRGVAAVDLQGAYRSVLRQRPDTLLYVPGDSHWSGEGIRVAAEATASAIASVTGLRARAPDSPTYYRFDYVGDSVKAFDPFPALTGSLRPIWKFPEKLLNGEEGRGYTYPSRPVGLVVVVGTSYTGQYTWIPEPVGFAWQLGLHLENTEVQNHPVAGRGSFEAFERFWSVRGQIEERFASRYGASIPKVVVWEFPIRDVGVIRGGLQFAEPSVGEDSVGYRDH